MFRLFDVFKTTTVKISMLFTPPMISCCDFILFFWVFSVLWRETFLSFGIIQSVNSHAAQTGPLVCGSLGVCGSEWEPLILSLSRPCRSALFLLRVICFVVRSWVYYFFSLSFFFFCFYFFTLAKLDVCSSFLFLLSRLIEISFFLSRKTIFLFKQ